LKICDAEIEHLNKKENVITSAQTGNYSQPTSTTKLSVSDLEALREVEILLGEVREGSQQASSFLLRKMTNILEDLSSSRNLILDCNDFLVQL